MCSHLNRTQADISIATARHDDIISFSESLINFSHISSLCWFDFHSSDSTRKMAARFSLALSNAAASRASHNNPTNDPFGKSLSRDTAHTGSRQMFSKISIPTANLGGLTAVEEMSVLNESRTYFIAAGARSSVEDFRADPRI